jgi:hypothetical protein
VGPDFRLLSKISTQTGAGMIKGLVVLIIWYGVQPVYMGQYPTKQMCWNMVERLTLHGIGSDEEFQFQCVDLEKDSQ